MKNKVQLITYAERFSGNAGQPGNLKAFTTVLEGALANVFGGVHLLPFYDSIHGADAGFDPKDHLAVDASLGDWESIKRLSHSHAIMADVIVNHISAQSQPFQDFLKQGNRSPYKSLFLTQQQVFPQGATDIDLQRIYRPRPIPAFTLYTSADQSQHLMWTTFTPEQIDIDVTSEQGLHYLHNILRTLASNGVQHLRLDAVGYAIKKAGSSCFMLPETFSFIGELSNYAKSLGMTVLVEVHSYYQTQIAIAKQVDRVYDFALPPLILHAFHFKTSRSLKHWIDIRPTNAVTVLDTHDGIGVIDIGSDKSDRNARPGLVPDAELDALVEAVHSNSQGQSRQATGGAASNLDLYQVNCTYYDALARHDAKYLIARAIQFFLPGIPQVYYVGLLAGHNDMQLLAQTGVGRDINRHYYSEAEINEQLKRPVVQQLLDLIKLRNTHPAFDGSFSCQQFASDQLLLVWQSNLSGGYARFNVDFTSARATLVYSASSGEKEIAFA